VGKVGEACLKETGLKLRQHFGNRRNRRDENEEGVGVEEARRLTRCFLVAGRGWAYSSVLVSALAGAPRDLTDVA
jgi:hypothetical protein